MPSWLLLLGVSLLLAAVTFVLAAYRSTMSPDVLADDLIYSTAGRNIAAGHGLTVQGQGFFWQPPLFQLLLAPVAQVGGLTSGSLIEATLQLRPVNAVLAALTAVVLFLLLRRLWNARAGVLAALLYASDPYVLSVTRHLYIEPMALLLVIASLWLVYESAGRWTPWRCLACGAVFGLVLLTKELGFYVLLVPALLCVQRQMRWRELGIVVVTAVACYGGYAVWAALDGHGGQFAALKVHQFLRFIGVLHYTGLNAPGHSLVASLRDNLHDDWSSYLLLLLAVPSAVWLWRTRTRGGRFLAQWYALSAVLLAFLGIFGTLNAQFFYYVMIPVTAVIACAGEGVVSQALRRRRSEVPATRHALRFAGMLACIALLATVLAQATRTWDRLYASRNDTGYLGLVSAINQMVPSHAVIGVPRSLLELLHFAYPSGRYRLVEVVTAGAVRRLDIRWYAVSSKDPDLGDLTEGFYADLTTHGTLRWRYDGVTFRSVSLWSLEPSALTGGLAP